MAARTFRARSREMKQKPPFPFRLSHSPAVSAAANYLSLFLPPPVSSFSLFLGEEKDLAWFLGLPDFGSASRRFPLSLLPA